MSKGPIERIEFLAKKFNVFTNEELDILVETNFIEEESSQCYQTVCSVDDNGVDVPLALYKFKLRGGNIISKDDGTYVIKGVRIGEDVFVDMVQSDPTKHKEYVQWMLTTFTRLIKSSEFDDAIRFVSEDLWKAKEYLTLFHENKHKPKFKRMCTNNLAFKNISDPSNINQYRDLAQLFDAVDPYIERDLSNLEVNIDRCIKLHEGEIPYKDRFYTVFIPKTINSSRIFKDFTSWCTTASKGSFNMYVNKLTPLKEKSKLFIIINNNCFLPENDPNHSDKMYQFHFESEMMMDKSDRAISNVKSEILDKSKGLSEFFYDTLVSLAKADKSNVNKNKYVDCLITMGFTDILFEVMDERVDRITYNNENIEKLPDMRKFNNLQVLNLYNVKLKVLSDTVCDLTTLLILSLPENKIKNLPKNIGKLKNLVVLNISGNKIIEIPENIKELDKTNGGSLERVSYSDDLSDDSLQRLREYLPTTEIKEFKNNK